MPKVYNSIVVDGPIEQVWSRIRNFHDFSWAPSLIKSCEKVGEGGGYSVGARRLLNGEFLDTLIAYSEIERRMMYSMDEGPSPVSSGEICNYVGNLHLLPVTTDDTTFVEWSGSWESANTEAVEYMNRVYRSLLADLAAEFTSESRRSESIDQ
ncbi:Polyketide cyclase / dehydrase and lipid transport [Nitrosospira multiformis]|uniref:Polyketide cyclase / dehydrase and lipid transport n=1 Tax=Nitrosospira multiformis TaxID=1231 RepID=A0A1H8IJQ1_9PROT|nr:SRPBCC family protein [Nitrosospira multiformis]SEN68704.1 Polyketide cyclase / dehydrase and lipid transport [Nitrosospira multiformis]